MRNSIYKNHFSHLVMAFIVALILSGAGLGQTTEFTYQGRMTDGALPATANYDFQFTLYDAVSGGTQAGSTVTKSAVAVASGIFTVTLDFGNQFPGDARFLDISVKKTIDATYTPLTPRQPITSAPHSIRSLTAGQADNATNATTANNALNLGGVAASQYVQTGDARLSDARNPLPGSPNYVQPTDARLSDARNPLAGSTNYVQNTSAPQTANFNVTGTGTAGSMTVNGALTQGGIAPPAVAPVGQGRIYFDTATNKIRVSENGAAFVNLVGAGGVSGSGTVSSIPLWSAGTTLGNSVITQSANGVQLPNGVQLGPGTNGNSVTFGSPNSETGMTMSGPVGRADVRFDGTTLRMLAGPAGSPPSNGVAITSSNVQLPNNVSLGVGAQGNNVAFGSPNGETGMTISGTSGRADIRYDGTLKLLNGPGGIPSAAKGIIIDTSGNVGIGLTTTTPGAKLSVDGGNVTAVFGDSSSGTGVEGRTYDGKAVYGVSTIGDAVYGYSVSGNAGSFVGPVVVFGNLDVNYYASGGTVSVCRNGTRLAVCSSSLRYKTAIKPFSGGLSIINRLSPITFKWKADKKSDVGFGAEDVAKVEPLLITHNDKGEVEGVKYDRLSVVFVNAIKEQQAQIERLEQQLKQQQRHIDGLKRIMVRSTHKHKFVNKNMR